MWWSLLYSVIASIIVSYAIRNKIRKQKPKPGELDFPTAEQGRAIPVVFGTKEVKSPNVVWVGDKRTRTYESQGGGIFYYAGMHMVICHGVCDALKSVYVDGKVLFFTDLPYNTGLTSSAEIEADSPMLFGGKASEGGITGLVDILFGTPAQTQNAYLQTHLGNDIPAFRGVMSAVLKQVYLGNTQYIRPWSFVVQRIHKTTDGSAQWYDAKAQVNTPYQTLDADFTLAALNAPMYGAVFQSLSAVNNYIIRKPAGLTYQAWSPDGGTTWKNEFNVYVNSTYYAPTTYWSGTYASAALAEAAFEDEIVTIDSRNAFLFYIDITEAAGSRGNNSGGLSLEILSSHQNDMNPIHIVRELLTDTVIGMGASSGEIDSVSFEAAADICYNEGMGLSLVMDTRGTVEDAITDVLAHCGAVLYTDITTGKFAIKMVRDDYDVNSIPVLDSTNIIRVAKASRPTFSELVNSVTVSYYDYKLRAIKTVSAQDHALISAVGAVIDEKVEYLSFSNGDIAARAALRDLKMLSTPLLNASIECTREAATLKPGDVFLLNIDDFSNVVMRVQKITYGDAESNVVKIDAMEDSFSMTTYGVVTEQIEQDFIEPADMVDYFVEESPYHLLAERYGQSTANALLAGTPTFGAVSVAGANPASCNEAIVLEDGEDTSVMTFCAMAELDGDITSISTTTIPIQNWTTSIADVVTGSICYVGGEFMRVDNVDTGAGEITVGRGCLDTYPKLHTDGDVILFIGDSYTVTDTEYLDGDAPEIKLLTTVSGSVLAEADATGHTITMDSRAARPYPVADLQVDGDAEPDPDAAQAYPIDITWKARNRLRNVASAILDWFDAAETAEAGTTYDVLFEGLDINMVLLGTILSDNTSASTYELTSADITGSSYPEAHYIRATVTAVRGGLDCKESPYLVFKGVFEIPSLFGAAEDGCWYDPSDLSTLWQDVPGTTPVTTAGQTVAKMDDKSGNGNHAYPTAAVLGVTTSGYNYIKYTGSTGALGVTFGGALGADCTMVIAPPEKIGAHVYPEDVTIGTTPLVNRAHGEIVIVDRALTAGEKAALHSLINYPETFSAWPTAQDITDATGLWVQTATATATTSAMGATLTGTTKWSGLVAAPNGLIYGIPYNATTILIIDPIAGTASTSAMGATLTGTNKWISGVLGNDGLIYGIPLDSTDILIIDPEAGTASRSAMTATLTGTSKWAGGAVGSNGKIYCAPLNSADILIIDTGAGTASRSAMGATISGSSNWVGAVRAENGKIYCIPYSATTILIIDPAGNSATTSAMGATLTGGSKWLGGAIAKDGKIYCAPMNATDILIINPGANTATTSALGATLTGTNKWRGIVNGTDGYLYAIPHSETTILIIDVDGQSASKSALGATLPGSASWQGGTMGADGIIYGCPRDATTILKIRTYGTGGGAELSQYINEF